MTHTMKHTPGPWKVQVSSDETVEMRIKAGIEIIAHVCDLGSFRIVEQEGNANLFAAAPAMYEALQWARQYLRMPNFHPDNSYNSEQWAGDYNKLTDALVQAEGRDK